MIEYLAYFACCALGYRYGVDVEDGTLLLIAPDGSWDYWRPTSRWSRLLRWHFTKRN